MSFFVNECFVCEATDFITPCSRCYMISYCGPEHQKEDWPMHKEFCDAIWSLVRERKISHIYETLTGVDLDTWIKERKRMCWTVKSKLRRPLLLQEEQMLLMPRSCFVCHDTRQDLLTTCPVCFCANFCAEHPSSFEHEKDCLSLKLFREFDGKMQDPAKLRTIFTLIDKIPETTRFQDSSEVPHSIKEYLDHQIKGKDHLLDQACASNILSMSLTLFNALKKLNLQSASEILLHIRCDVTDSGIWELLLHFLPNLKLLNIVFIEQRESRKLVAQLCDDCVSKKKKMILEANELPYKNYVKIRIYKKPNIFAYLNAEISRNDVDNLEWKFLLENLSRIGIPVVLTSVTEKMAKVLSESLRSTFWPSLICYEGPNDFGALEPLREWTDGGVSKINQLLIVTKGRSIQCKAGFFHSSFLSKKMKEGSRTPLVFFYTNVCHVCRSEEVSIFCKYCNMIFYCSEPHRKEDWGKHKEICQAIQRLLKQSGMRSIFDGEIDLMESQKTDPESWLRAKVNLISKAESQLGKKLWVYQQQMFLFPKTCFVCHESEFSKLKGCECGIHLCKRHNDSPRHKKICKDFHLGLQLFEKEKLPYPLPKYKYVSGVKENLPGSIYEFIDLHLILESEATADKTPSFNRVIIGELLTKPLTLLYAVQKLMIPEFKNDHDSENNSTIVVHVIGPKNAENVYYEFWDLFFNWMQNLETLIVSFVGAETMNLNLNHTFPEVKEKNLSIKSYPLDYEQFVQSSFFVKPDIVIGYNLDIHECENETCSCRENILTVRKLNVPFVMTSGSKERAQKDHERICKVLESSVVYEFCDLNPFTSLVPERDFETEGLRFSNKYLLMYCNLDQPDVQNSKLRKYLLESLETKRLADDSHLSDFEKALKAMKIESSPISSSKNAESKSEANILGNTFLFAAAKHELRCMLRNFRCASKSDGCKNFGFKTNSGARDEKFSTGDSESKSEPRSAKNEISDENLLSQARDSEQKSKSESEAAIVEIFEENSLTVTEDSASKSKSGSATQNLFKENVFSTRQYSECAPELGTEHIWNELFEDSLLSIEDSISELESGYAKVEIVKNLKSTVEQDFESKSVSEVAHEECESVSESGSIQVETLKENLLPTTENHEFKLELEAVKEIKNLLSNAKFSEPKSEFGLTDDSVKDDLLLKLSATEDSENFLSTKDSESELKSGFGNVEILMEDLFATIENSESKSESESPEKEILKKNPMPLTEDAENKSEAEFANLQKSKDSFTTVDSESKPESESANFEILKDLLSITEDTERKSESGSVEDLVIKTVLLKLHTTEVSGSDSETGSSTEIEDSKFKSQSVNVKISEGDSLLTIENSKSKSENVPSKDESFEENVLPTADFQSESKSADNTLDLDEYLLSLSEHGASKESRSAKVETVSVSICENSVAKSDSGYKDLEFKSELGAADTTIYLEEYFSAVTEDFASKSEFGSASVETVPICEHSASKSEPESADVETVSISEDSASKSKSESANVEVVSTSENFVAKSESEYDKDLEFRLEFRSTNGETLKEDLLATTGDSESGTGTIFETFVGNLLTAGEEDELGSESESESESGSIKYERLKEYLLFSTEDPESKSESGSDSANIEILKDDLLSTIEDFESRECVFANGEILEKDLLPTTEESAIKSEFGTANNNGFKSESGSLREEILKENLLFIENSETKAESVSVPKSKPGDEKDGILEKSILSAIEHNLESKLKSGTNGNILKEDSQSKESGFANGEILKEDSLSTSKDSKTKSEIVAPKDELFNNLSSTEDFQSESRSGNSTLDVEECLMSLTEDSSFKLKSGSSYVEAVSINENFVAKSTCGFDKDLESEPEFGSTNGETLKEDLLPTTENSERKLESHDKSCNENSLLKTAASESKSDNARTLKEDSLSCSEDFESKLKSGSPMDELLKEESESGFVKDEILKNLLSAADCEQEFKSKSESEYGIAQGEKLKENLLATEDSETKSESSSVNVETLLDDLLTTKDSESKLKSGSLKDEIFNDLLFTENSESKAEFNSVKDEIFRKNLLTSRDQDFEYKSESAPAVEGTLKENLLSVAEVFESKSESGTAEEELKEDLMPTTGDAEYFKLKPESNSSKKIKDSDSLSNFGSIAENTESESASAKNEIFKVNLLPATEDFESKSESGTDKEKFREDLLPTTGNSENFKLKSEFESFKEIEDCEFLSKSGSPILEDLEFESESPSIKDEMLKENLLPTTEDFELKSESGFAKEKLKEDLLPTTGDSQQFKLNSESESSKEIEDSESVSKSGSAIVEDPELESEFAFAKDEVFKENLLHMTEDFESKSESGTAEEKLKEDLLSKTGDSQNFKLKSESESSKEDSESSESFDKIFKNLLPATEDFESKSKSGTSEKKLKEDLLSMTGDSECRSESRRANKELFRENLLLKEEIRRLRENEELIKSENSHLKEELRRLRQV